MNSTCQLIKDLREQTGLSASQFAKVMGVSKSSVSKWENDEVPSIEHLYQMARYFRVTVDELLNGALNSDSNFDKFAAEYDLSSFDVPKLLKEGNYEEAIQYFKKCQNIKNTFYKLLPRVACNGLKNIDLAEYKYVSKYFSANPYILKFDIDYSSKLSGKLDPNELKSVKDFYEKIKPLSKPEKEWEINKMYDFRQKLYVDEVIASHNFNLFSEMFKTLIQVDKDNILNNTIDRSSVLNVIRNKYVLAMLECGGRVLKSGGWHCNNWSEEAVKSFDGELIPVNRVRDKNYHDSKYYSSNGDCSYSEYLDVVDEEKTALLKEACRLRKNKPIDYYSKLKSGCFDALLNF